MSLQITSQKAILAWDSQSAVLTQSGNGKQTLDIRVEKNNLKMETVKPQVSIDQMEAFGELGLKGIRAFMQESVGYAQQMVSTGIDRIVSQGNEWLDIHTGYDPIPDQARYNAFEMFEKSFDGVFSPVARPQIDVQSGQLNFNFTPSRVINSSVAQPVEMNYQPWRIDYYMKQYNRININHTSTQINQSV
ncbi:MAG: hypothetical protein IBX70_10985 [Clostridia bacterium]|nr:hypothetical protein [Clostridia bacterium]